MAESIHFEIKNKGNGKKLINSKLQFLNVFRKSLQELYEKHLSVPLNNYAEIDSICLNVFIRCKVTASTE